MDGTNCIEKIYCCDRDNNDNALVAAILANSNRENPLAYAMMNGGMNNWMNNPFAYLMFLALFRNGFGFGDNSFGGQNAQNVEMQNQLQAIRTQLNDNQNSTLLMDAIKGNEFALSQLSQNLQVDFNSLQKGCCDIQAAIQQVAGQVGFSAERVINAANLGDCNIIQQLKDCCCNTQKSIADLRADLQLQLCQYTGELRNGQRDLGAAITQGFASTAYETQRQTCEIINAGKDNTQRILDTLNAHWGSEKDLKIQDLKFELSQERQNNLLLSRLSGCGCCTCSCGCGQ